jgi:hypothetical protein
MGLFSLFIFRQQSQAFYFQTLFGFARPRRFVFCVSGQSFCHIPQYTLLREK